MLVKNSRYYNLEELLPHKNPMVLIDKLVEYDLEKRTAVIEVYITEKSMFYDSIIGGIPVYVGIEYMAQAVGAIAGVLERESGREPQVAFLLGTRSYTASISHFKSGECYTIYISENFTDTELGSYSCKIMCNDNECASASLNTFKPADPKKFLNNMGLQ